MVAAEMHFQVAELVRVVYEIYKIARMIDNKMRILVFSLVGLFASLVQEYVEIYTWHWRLFPFYFSAQYGAMEFFGGTCCVV